MTRSGEEPAQACRGPGGSSSAFRRRFTVASAILLLPACMLAGVWMLGGVSANADDLIYYLPIRQFVGERIRAGELPLWNPWASMGTSVAADPQSGLWYPSTLLFVVLSPLKAYSLSLYLHYVLAGWGMYRFLRSLDREWRAALLGAIAFEFSAHMVAHRQHLTIQHVTAWIPWMFYGWQRFTAGGGLRHALVAASALGIQLLAQHIQPTIIACSALTAYAGFVLWPQRRSLWWQFPLVMSVGAALGAVQLLPTWSHFAMSGRSTPSYHVFIENSWTPPSLLMFLFPMIFGTPTPNVWSEQWWGVSHLCEQWPYASILILVLAVSSLSLIQREKDGVARAESSPADACGSPLGRCMSREILFWWVACVAALLIALGEINPLSKLLFHLPVYRSLRVPARWILVWSVAMPVLASAVASVILAGRPGVDAVLCRLRFVCTRLLPAAALGAILLMAAASWVSPPVRWFISASASLHSLLAGLGHAARPTNPAVFVPLLIMAATAVACVHWSRTRSSRLFVGLFIVFLCDLASVVPFIDLDTRTYSRENLSETPPLTQAIRDLNPVAGDRLLVPRTSASYARPLEVLWPQTNVRLQVATMNGYGPLWPVANRLLLRFVPWGSSEDMLELLRNRPLLRMLGVRFIAARSSQERELVTTAMWPLLAQSEVAAIPSSEPKTPVPSGKGVIWPVRVDQPGLYRLSFDVVSGETPQNRWFVRIETSPNDPIGDTRSVEPVDLCAGPRRLRFLFRCDRAVGAAYVRLKSERGCAILAGGAEFGRVAEPPKQRPSSADDLRLSAMLPEDIALYEVPRALPLVYWADGVSVRADLVEVATMLQDKPPSPGVVVVSPELAGVQSSGMGTLSWTRTAGSEVRIAADSERGGLIVVNESYDPGWFATVDGTASTVHCVNALFTGIVVPPGPRTIVLRYQPAGLRAGAAVSISAATAIFAALIISSGRCLRRQAKGARRGGMPSGRTC